MKRPNMRSKHERDIRKQRNQDRIKREHRASMGTGKEMVFIYWGWTSKDPSPFLGIKLEFKKPIIPDAFINDLKSILNEVFHEHL